MKSALIAVALIAFAAPAFAQTDTSQYDPQTWFAPACPSCGVLAYLDVPSSTSTISRTDLLAGNVQFQGWGFECVSGAPIDRVDVYVETSDGVWTPVKQGGALRFGSIYRPDAAAAFRSSCPNVGDWTGWALQITTWPDWALGARRVQLWIWKGPYHARQIRTYNITQ